MAVTPNPLSTVVRYARQRVESSPIRGGPDEPATVLSPSFTPRVLMDRKGSFCCAGLVTEARTWNGAAECAESS